VESSPLRVFAITGNTDTMNAEAATGLSPAPSSTTRMGASATIGTVWKKIM
jgi:hypothetical protein